MSWLKSPVVKGALAAAFAGGLAAAAASLTDPVRFNIFDQESALALGKMALSGAIGGLILYFKNPPTKPWDGQDRRTDAQP